MEFSKQYLSYEEYRSLGGTLEETPFNILELEAQKQIDKYTFGRLMGLENQNIEVKVCDFMLINEINNYNKLNNSSEGNRMVASENIDGYSVSYLSADVNALKLNVDRIKGIIRTYLAECKLDNGTPYLYRGVDKNAN